MSLNFALLKLDRSVWLHTNAIVKSEIPESIFDQVCQYIVMPLTLTNVIVDATDVPGVVRVRGRGFLRIRSMFESTNPEWWPKEFTYIQFSIWNPATWFKNGIVLRPMRDPHMGHADFDFFIHPSKLIGYASA